MRGDEMRIDGLGAVRGWEEGVGGFILLLAFAI